MTRDEHEAQLRAVAWFRPRELAARWAVTIGTVYGLPRADLPYVQLGTGSRRTHRRYSPEAVAAFEMQGGVRRQGAA